MAMKARIDNSPSTQAKFVAQEQDLERRAVLCASDGSAQSDAAVWRAHAIAEALGAKLLLLHVVDSTKSPTRAADDCSARARGILDAQACNLARWGSGVDISVRVGRPYETIGKVAVEWDADLIVLGPYRRRFGDGLRGTTAERIAAKAQRPVLVVNGQATVSYQQVLLAADLSRMSAGIARVTKQLGLLKRSRASVVHATEHTSGAMLYMAGMRESEAAEYHRSLCQLTSEEIDVRLFSAGLDSADFTIFSPQGSPGRAIEQVAQRIGSDLVVVGSSRLPAFKRVFLGSVSNELLRGAKRDVLLVSPAAARRVRQRASALEMHRVEVESPQRSLDLH
jgi:nucleotide-binding universal stress UspA family protein